MHTCMHTHTLMHVKHDKDGWGGHLQFLYIYSLVLRTCIHVCACGGMWKAPQDTPTPTPTTARARDLKSLKCNKT